VIYFADCPFRIPCFTHHFADLSAFLDSALYLPHSAILHFTNNRPHRACTRPEMTHYFTSTTVTSGIKA